MKENHLRPDYMSVQSVRTSINKDD